MKAILTMTMMLSLLITSVYAHPPTEKPNEGLITEQHEKNIKLCTQNLVAIGKAIQAYQKEHGDFPQWLSELYPKYLADAEILLCPADNKGGKPIYSKNADPKMPVSYGYQFHPGYRKSTQENRAVYGDVIPLARCRHHNNQEFECLNLGFSFKVYKSPGVWQDTPEVMYETIEKTITALEAGLQRQPDIVRSFELYCPLVRLYIEVGRKKDVDSLIKRFRSSVKPGDLQTQTMLGAILEKANRYEEMLTVYEKLEKQYPNKSFVLNELARIHEKLGNSELAAEYKEKADPMAALVGKVIPDFSATDLDGKPISLEQYRGKVVLLDFWAVWCPPCIVEMPNVKRVYNSYKDQGFDVIGVSLDTDETRLRNYLKENDISWRQIFSGQRWNSSLAKQYHINAIPAPWLIARDGTLISREARGIALERLIVEALKDKTENE